LLILELFLDSISAFWLRKAHFVSNLDDFLVTLPSLAKRALCKSIFSSKLLALVINLLIAWFSLLLVQFVTNYFSLVSNFALALPMARFSLLLAHFSTNSISLVSTFALELHMASFSLD
jgi:hypothetical protein